MTSDLTPQWQTPRTDPSAETLREKKNSRHSGERRSQALHSQDSGAVLGHTVQYAYYRAQLCRLTVFSKFKSNLAKKRILILS